MVEGTEVSASYEATNPLCFGETLSVTVRSFSDRGIFNILSKRLPEGFRHPSLTTLSLDNRLLLIIEVSLHCFFPLYLKKS